MYKIITQRQIQANKIFISKKFANQKYFEQCGKNLEIKFQKHKNLGTKFKEMKKMKKVIEYRILETNFNRKKINK